MLLINFKKYEVFDETKEVFITVEEKKNRHFENSLKAIAKWESKYTKSFFKDEDKNNDEILDYLSMMCEEEDISSIDFINNPEAIELLLEYVNKKHSATTFSSNLNENNSQIVTTELIYGYMSLGKIPYEAENWNIERLLNLVRVIGELNKPKEEMSRKDTMELHRKINQQRRG